MRDFIITTMRNLHKNHIKEEKVAENESYV